MTTLAPSTLVLGTVEVSAVERLTPAFVRVWLSGAALGGLGVTGGWLDQRIKLIFPADRSRKLPDLVPDSTWYAQWLALDETMRGAMRTYTVRAVVGTGAATRLVVDVVVHDPAKDSGPGNAWALVAEPGDRVLVVAPRRGHEFGGRGFCPTDGSPLLLLADETAVPAVAGILRDVAPQTRGLALLEVPTDQDTPRFDAPVGVEVLWLPRGDRARGELLMEQVVARIIPRSDQGTLYAWIAGESQLVTDLRRYLVHQVGLKRDQVEFMGYWREGVAMRS